MRLSLRLSLIFLFLLLTSNFLLPIYGQVWLEITPKAGADQVDTLRPAMDKYINWFEVPDVDSEYKNIDDVTPDEDATYLWNDNTTVVTPYSQGWFHNAWSSSNIIDSARLVVRAKTTATDGLSKINLGRAYLSGEPPYTALPCTPTDTFTVGTSWADSSITWTQDPCTDVAWTQTNLNNATYWWYFNSLAVGSPPDSFGVTGAALNKVVNAAGWIGFYRYQATFSDSVDMLSIYCKNTDGTPSAFKLGLYTDSVSGTSHFPKYLMDTVAAFTLAVGWNRRSLVNGKKWVTEDNWYWIGYRPQANGDTIKNESATARGWDIQRSYDSSWQATLTGGQNENADVDLQVIRTLQGQNQVTQSFVVVYSHEVAAGGIAGRRRMIIQLQGDD